MVRVEWKESLTQKESSISYFNTMREFGKWNDGKEHKIIDVKKVKKMDAGDLTNGRNS